ncbi:MAG: hypothetical protein ILM98_14265 [Kiritimatiellae bacterium]|nr:hypothetical protein [Kiritimatiellia bacterium]
MKSETGNIPPGWHIDEASGCLVRDTIHHMGRRCRNWDYCGKGCYLITMTLRDRSRPVLGSVRRAIDGSAEFTPSPLGERIEAHLRRIPEFSPEMEVLGSQLMPDHMHVVLRVRRRMARPLGECLRGFKIGATKIAREEGNSPMDGRALGEAARGHGLFADGFVDTILFDEAALSHGLAYMADNPRRLLEKREHPELFRVVRDLEFSPIDGRELRFAAIGNRHLLEAPALLQVQCSRRDFAYAKASDGSLAKDAPPTVCTPFFEEKAAEFLAAAAHGAVLVSPCISHGEREIARRALQVGARLIALQNKGFPPLFKPSGLFFERCVEGRLLLLAPAGWTYLPGEKRMTREDACVLNRIAQMLCGAGAAKINYHGLVPEAIDRLVERSMP